MKAAMNRVRYTEHRIRGSLERHVGQSPTDDSVVAALARRAYRDGIFVFTRAMLDRMKPFERTILEGLAKNFNGDGR